MTKGKEPIEEYGWLVEQIIQGATAWLSLSNGKFTFICASNQAIRFARKEDADAMISLLKANIAMYSLCTLEATDHFWYV